MPLNLVTPGDDVPNDVNVTIWVKIDGWLGPEEAKAEIVASIERFKAAPDKPQF